jgi:hypothetical protein
LQRRNRGNNRAPGYSVIAFDAVEHGLVRRIDALEQPVDGIAAAVQLASRVPRCWSGFNQTVSENRQLCLSFRC